MKSSTSSSCPRRKDVASDSSPIAELLSVRPYRSTRSEECSIGAVDLILTPDRKGSGKLLPACKLTEDKRTQRIEVETYQNPWNLTNFMISNN